VVVYDQQLTHAGIHQPDGHRPRADAVVRHEPDQRGTVEPDERGHRRDLQHPGVPENRRRLHYLRRMEVAEVGERARIIGGAASIRYRQRLAILAERAERDELDVCLLRPLERQLGAAQHLAPRRPGRTRQRQARVDPAQATVTSLRTRAQATRAAAHPRRASCPSRSRMAAASRRRPSPLKSSKDMCSLAVEETTTEVAAEASELGGAAGRAAGARAARGWAGSASAETTHSGDRPGPDGGGEAPAPGHREARERGTDSGAGSTSAEATHFGDRR
jgi:hypothetical protein